MTTEKLNRLGQQNTPLVDEVLADLTPEGQHEKRLSRYSSAKTRQTEVLDHIITTLDDSGKGKLQREAEALEGCGSFLIFRHYFTVDIYKMIAGCTCKKHLLCALCAIRRAAKYIAVYASKINSLVSPETTEFDSVMITFTIKNGDDLGERFDHLLSSMKKLLKKRNNARRVNAETDTMLKVVESAVYSYEITYNEKTGYHPHCHMIALVPKGVLQFRESVIKGKTCLVPWDLQKDLCSCWLEITGDSFIIDTRKIEEKEDTDNSLLMALVEVFKYALKMNDLDVKKQVDVYETLKGRRLIGCFGALRGVHVSENLNDTPLQDEELPFIDLLYQYSGVTFGYQEILRGQFDLEPVPRAMLDLQSRIKENRRKGKRGHSGRTVKRRQVFTDSDLNI